jgi:hypothetical protein
VRPAPGGPLGHLGHAQATAAVLRPVAAVVLAHPVAVMKVGGGPDMADEPVSRKVWIACAEPVNQGPQGGGIGWALVPAGKEGATIGKRQRNAQIQADQRGRRKVAQHIEHFVAAPATRPRWHQHGRPAARIGQRQGNALVPLPPRARPVDGEEVPESHWSRSRRSLLQ